MIFFFFSQKLAAFKCLSILLKQLEIETDVTAKRKLVMAISGLLAGNEIKTKEFVAQDGVEVLMQLVVKESDSAITTKCLFLLLSLLRSDTKGIPKAVAVAIIKAGATTTLPDILKRGNDFVQIEMVLNIIKLLHIQDKKFSASLRKIQNDKAKHVADLQKKKSKDKSYYDFERSVVQLFYALIV
jgi:hypothetical protein